MNTLVGTYLNFAILPPYGGARLFDVHKGNKKIARAQNSGGQLDMVDTVGLFARGGKLCKYAVTLAVVAWHGRTKNLLSQAASPMCTVLLYHLV